MKKFIVLAAFVSAILSMSAHAGFISGDHTLSNGKTVALQGLEWMPLTYTAGLSRLDIEDGFTDRMRNSWSATDWRYATRDETEKLLGSLWGGIRQLDESNFAGADWFLSNFGTFYNYSARFFFGADGDCDSVRSMSCIGEVSISYHSVHGGGDWGKFLNEYGLKLTPEDRVNNYVYKLRTDLDGSLLVRNVSIPEPDEVTTPSSVALMILGLGLFPWSYRKNKRG